MGYWYGIFTEMMRLEYKLHIKINRLGKAKQPRIRLRLRTISLFGF